MTIELIEREASGELCALVSVNGDLIEVTRRFGSWTTLPNENTGKFREILPAYARELQLAAKHI
jgi:hypothetical protein